MKVVHSRLSEEPVHNDEKHNNRQQFRCRLDVECWCIHLVQILFLLTSVARREGEAKIPRASTNALPGIPGNATALGGMITSAYAKAQASFFNSTGKGPYLRTETMALFCCCVKPVGIMNGPLIALLITADAMTLPSRVIVRACPMLLAV